MTRYLNAGLPARGKADVLLLKYEGISERVPPEVLVRYVRDPEARRVLLEYPGSREAFSALESDGVTAVCVVENGPFDAAAVVDTLEDMLHFLDDSDGRPRRWLGVPTEIVDQLVGPLQ